MDWKFSNFNLLGAPASRRPVGSRKPELAGGTRALPGTVLRFKDSKRELVRGILLLLLAVIFAGGCGKPRQNPSLDLPIYFTCDTQGRLEPCGCFVGQFGGLTRLKTVLEAEAPTNALRLDAGDAIGGKEDYDLIQYRYMLRAFAAMHYDALNMGQREAKLSAAQLKEFNRTSPVPMLSANLRDKADGKPIFDSYRILQRGGFRVAVIGLLDPHGLGDNLGQGLEVEDMESALTRCLAEVRSKADLIVLLAFTDEETLSRLADQFYECQVILGGKVSQTAQELRRQNRSLIYFVTNESRALGILRLKLAEGAPLQVLNNEIRLLHDRIPQDPSFRQLARDYRDEVRHTRLAVDDPGNLGEDMVPGVRTAASYVGTETCVSCHPGAAAVWEKSTHAHAFAPLLERQADADPKCVGCHTVGFGSASGYRREFGSARLVQAGCESCHGPGSLHIRQQAGDTSINFTFRPLAAGDCKQCHYGEFSRPFDWDEFWPAIKHGREPQPARIASP
ncbi:MAG: multiheme c-type cytochrome [Verrucomicrobiia bacterium]